MGRRLHMWAAGYTEIVSHLLVVVWPAKCGYQVNLHPYSRAYNYFKEGVFMWWSLTNKCVDWWTSPHHISNLGNAAQFVKIPELIHLFLSLDSLASFLLIRCSSEVDWFTSAHRPRVGSRPPHVIVVESFDFNDWYSSSQVSPSHSSLVSDQFTTHRQFRSPVIRLRLRDCNVYTSSNLLDPAAQLRRSLAHFRHKRQHLRWWQGAEDNIGHISRVPQLALSLT